MTHSKKSALLVLSLAALIAFAGSVACQKKAEQATEAVKTVDEFTGTVRAALGRYMYLSAAQGFDIVLPGFDAATLVGKTITVKGNLLPDHPPVFLADGVISNGQTIYTRTEDFKPEDFVEMKTREAVPALDITGFNKPEEWEGKTEGKIYGKLETNEPSRIIISDEKGKPIAYVIVDSVSTYSDYYLQKLKLFDHFWFYLKIKESVERRDRTKTKQIFHADVFDVGLF
jgi:hypothetical protein